MSYNSPSTTRHRVSPVGSSSSPSCDSSEIDRYCRHLFYKTAQIVVQARQGDKMKTTSSARPKTKSWFCINVQDVTDINQETRRGISCLQNSDQNILSNPLCVEISLRTSEGDSMVMESWVLSVKKSVPGSEPSVRGSNTIYNHMTILLKSVLSVSRALPAYRLSRRQGPDSFVMCYRVYAGEPATSVLGEGHMTCPVGQVLIPQGLLCLRCDYRVSMTIAPSTCRSQPSLEGSQPQSRAFRTRSNTNDSNPRISDDSTTDLIITSDESADLKIFATSPATDTGIHYHQYHQSDPPRRRLSGGTHMDDSGSNIIDQPLRIGAFAVSKQMQKEKSFQDPLMDLFKLEEVEEAKEKLANIHLKGEGDTKNKDQSDAKKDQTEGKKGAGKKHPVFHLGGDGDEERKSSKESFDMLETIKTPFSRAHDSTGDLGVFFKDVQTAAAARVVEELKEKHGGDQEDDNLEDQLANFEANLADFDDMLKTLETSESESEHL